jgi:hypothetical protein
MYPNYPNTICDQTVIKQNNFSDIPYFWFSYIIPNKKSKLTGLQNKNDLNS